jgi:hypothetical protein
MLSNWCRTLVPAGSAAFLLCASIAQAQITIDPASLDITLEPGEEFCETKTVTIPGGDPVTKVDIYFLADTTGSMFSVIDQLQDDATDVLTALAGKIADVQFGAGEYKDFPFDPFCFMNHVSMTTDLLAVEAGIDMWAAFGGADGPEGQFFALDQISDPGDPFGIGFRSDAQKIIVWFGDAPAHEPVCAAISGLGYDIDETSVKAKLVAEGFTVIAIGTTTGYAFALNDDPTLGGGDYTPPCAFEGGVPGQATRIAADTGGVDLQDVAPADISQAICDAVFEVVSDVTVELVPAGDTAPYTTVLTPPYVDVPLPPEGEVLELVFEVCFVGPPCDPGLDEHVFTGTVDAIVDEALAAQQDVTIRVPSCDVGPCFTLDFQTEDDFATPLVNGQHINDEFGAMLAITSSGPNAGAGIFDSSDPGPNSPSQDLDLLVQTGNILILQTENFPPDGSDIFPRPNDDEDGGTLTFSFGSAVMATSVRLIDLDATDGTCTVVLTDGGGMTRTYSVPSNWTGDWNLSEPGQGTLDLTILADQPGFGSTATASQMGGFDANNVVRIDVTFAGSGGVDDLAWCAAGAGFVNASAAVRNGEGINPLSLENHSLPVIGGTWASELDCAGHASGLSVLLVRSLPASGIVIGYGELLIAGTTYFRAIELHSGDAVTYRRDIPNQLSLVGLGACVQGLCTGAPGAQLSNALDLVLGF